jgi:hypothetical protein
MVRVRPTPDDASDVVARRACPGQARYHGRRRPDWGAPAERKHGRAALAGSYEALFQETGEERFILRLAQRGGAVGQALATPRLEHAIGVIYLPRTERHQPLLRGTSPGSVQCGHAPRGPAGAHGGLGTPASVRKPIRGYCERGEPHAREANTGAGAAGSAGRQAADHAGGRVRPGRDPSPSKRQARCPLDEASHRHRAEQGAASRGEARSSAGGNEVQDAAECRLRIASRTPPSQALAHPVARHVAGVETRGPRAGVTRSAGTAGPRGGSAARWSGAESGGTQGRSHAEGGLGCRHG